MEFLLHTCILHLLTFVSELRLTLLWTQSYVFALASKGVLVGASVNAFFGEATQDQWRIVTFNDSNLPFLSFFIPDGST
jgi:hypothetical protein